MEEQNYAKHARFDPPFHYVLVPLSLAILIGSFVNLFQSFDDHSRLYNAALIAAMALALFVNTFLTRISPLRAQDRTIRAEENMRHYVLTGKLLDPRLTVKQIIGLRFASDAEFVALAARAASEGLSQDDIKKAVKSWRADHDRV